jgi:hypothetical protein
MITGFNPSDLYAADHIRRVLQTFPGVFTTGIGEFTIHKEFVSAKIAGEVASLAFAGDAGLVVLIQPLQAGRIRAWDGWSAPRRTTSRRSKRSSAIPVSRT